MPITGNIKFFQQSGSLFSKGATATATSNAAAVDNVLSMRKEFRWVSVGSNDATTETITVTLPNPIELNRIFLIGHNLRDFSVTYDVVPQNFTNVIGLDGAVAGGIIETTYDKDTAYYEFDPVTTDTFTITMNTTQIPNQEKFLNIFISTFELATLVGYPETSVDIDNNERRDRVLSGRALIQKWYQVAQIDLSYRVYSGSFDNRVFFELYTRYRPFLVWLCGGVYGDEACDSPFSYQQAGYRLEDVYQVNTVGGYDVEYYRSSRKFGLKSRLRLVECVDR